MTIAYPVMRDLPAEERPRERLRLRGPEALTNAELIAILLRTGAAGENVVAVASRILARFGGIAGLGRAGFAELAGERAMGDAKACQVLAAIELGKRVVNAEPAEKRVLDGPGSVYSLLFAEMALLEQEELKVILLSTRHEVLAVKDVYKGNVNTILVRPADLLRDAVREGCPAVVVVHNHPSGDPSPSAEDRAITGGIIEAGRLLGIEVLDHVIIARRGYYSMKEGGMGFG